MSKIWISYGKNTECGRDLPVVIDHSAIEQFHSEGYCEKYARWDLL